MSDNFPSCVDFIAMYGCESTLNDDYEQISIFNNEIYRLVLLTTVLFNHIDIKLYENDELLIHIYEEGVERLELLNNLVNVYFKDEKGYFDKKSMEIVVFPKFFISSISMRN